MDIRLFHASRIPSSARKPALIRRACTSALGPKARRAGGLNVVFMDRAGMRRINKRYLAHDYDTDVISFPLAAADSFGEVYVSVFQARRQAREIGHGLLRELLTLAIHGTLHLVGYDDHAPAKKRRMFARQDRILKALLRAKS